MITHLFTQGRQLAEYISEEPGIRRKIEERYGPSPSDIEAFSLWLTAITPMSESDKLSLLASKDTKDRLQRVQLALGAYVSQQSSNRQRAAAAAEASGGQSAAGGLTGAVATAVRTMMNMIRSRSGSQNEDEDEEAAQGTAEAEGEREGEEEVHVGEAVGDEEDDTQMSEDDGQTSAAEADELVT